MNALTFLDARPSAVQSSPDLLDDGVVFESIGGRIYGEAPRSGLSFIVDDDGRIRTVQLYAEGHEGYKGYVGSIPCGVRFDMSRAEVRSQLGTPSASGEPKRVQTLGEMPAWDRFELPEAHMHLRYTMDQRSVLMVTLMKSSAVPGLM